MNQLIFEFLSNNFEFIFFFNLAILIFLLVFVFALKVHEFFIVNEFTKAVGQLLFSIVVVGEIILLFLSGYLYWMNYLQRNPGDLQARLLSDTHWMDETLTIYFIHDHELLSIDTRGQKQEVVFQAPHKILEYHFSPKGNDLLIVTEKELYALNRWTKKLERIDVISATPSKEMNGVIRGISWGPDSHRFCYEISRWSSYAAKNNYYVFDLKTMTKQEIPSPTRKIPYLYWDKEGNQLYYFRQEAKDTSYYSYPFKHEVYQISLSSLETKKVFEIPSRSSKISYEELRLYKNINIFEGAAHLSFGRNMGATYDWVSSKGTRLGIDKDDFLFFMQGKWWKKRLFLVMRDHLPGELSRYQYRGRPWSIRQVKWLPRGQYAILAHSSLGILILEPITGKIGKLVQASTDSIGWYEAPKN